MYCIMESVMKCVLTIWSITLLGTVTETSDRFMKDQSMSAEFPGPVYKQSDTLPDGHMRPLGWQRRPDAPITELAEMPDSYDFYLKFVSTNTPVVFRRAITQAPAFTKWANDKYLTEKYGHLNVTVRAKVARRKSRIASQEKVVKLNTFLLNYMYDDLYMESGLPREMMSELPFPKCIRCGTISENLAVAQLLMSGGVSSSRLQSHDDPLLQCVLFGRRDYILIEVAHKQSLPYANYYTNSLSGYSDMDTDRVNAFEFKNILRVPWTWSTLKPGDCLFVPAGYIYHVRSYGRSISTSFQFFKIKEFDNTECHLEYKEFVPLRDADFLLTYADGRLRLSDLEIDVEKLREILIHLTDKDDVLTSQKFSYFYMQIFGEGTDLPASPQVFELLTRIKHGGILTRKRIIDLNNSILQKVVDIFNTGYAELRRKEQQATLNKVNATINETSHRKHEEF
uniref:JmjC domain-containing protein n=1 Tax=Arion vulgaris TaxID=1028688 RepID=A0A0B7A0M6_9EUPU